MYGRLPISVLTLVLLTGVAPTVAMAADSAADAKYSYRPYGQGNQAGSDAENSPANSSGRVPAEPKYAPANVARPQAAAPTGRDDAWRPPPPGQADESDRDDRSNRGDAYVPPDRPMSPPAGGSASPPGATASRLIEATANAPDRSVPFDVREQDARRAAIEAWRSKAAASFGPEFSQWRLADQRHVDCVRDRRDDAVCTVRGVPTRGDAQFSGRYPDDRD